MENRVVIYLRVSDQSQIENNSLETQEKSCRVFAKTKQGKVIKIFRDEGKSAKHVYTRPALRELFSYCAKKQNNINAVIVYKFDRFSRDTHEGLAAIALLAKSKVEVLSATEVSEINPMGTAMRTILMALGQLDNEMKGERVRDNMQEVFRKGLWPFKCPIGYKRQYRTKEENRGKPVIPDPNLSPIINKMFINASTGIYNKSQLARMMNLDGFGTYYKNKATHKIVDNILSKTFYFGYMYAQKWKEYAWGKHEPLIDKITWEKAYRNMVGKKGKYKFQDEISYPLKGCLLCEHCNKPLTTTPSQGRSKIYYYYECRNKLCRKTRIDSKIAHEKFYSLLQTIKPTERVLKLFEHIVFAEWDKVINETKKQAGVLDKRIATLKTELSSIRKAKDDGIYTVEEAVEQAGKLLIDYFSILLQNPGASMERSEMNTTQKTPVPEDLE